MIKAVIFDCFGVLAEDAWLPFKRQYIGEDTYLAEEVSNIGKQNEYGYITKEQYIEQVSVLLGVEQRLLRSVLHHKVPNVDLIEYIKKFLKPKLKIGILSNANFNVVKEIFTSDQAEIFDAITLSFECGLIKPDQRIFKIAANRLGVNVDECLFVDDVERYCIAAEETGMKSIVYRDLEGTIQRINQFL